MLNNENEMEITNFIFQHSSIHIKYIDIHI